MVFDKGMVFPGEERSESSSGAKVFRERYSTLHTKRHGTGHPRRRQGDPAYKRKGKVLWSFPPYKEISFYIEKQLQWTLERLRNQGSRFDQRRNC